MQAQDEQRDLCVVCCSSSLETCKSRQPAVVVSNASMATPLHSTSRRSRKSALVKTVLLLAVAKVMGLPVNDSRQVVGFVGPLQSQSKM